MQANKKLTKDELALLQTIREKRFQNITININDGKIVLIRREETIKPTPDKTGKTH